MPLLADPMRLESSSTPSGAGAAFLAPLPDPFAATLTFTAGFLGAGVPPAALFVSFAAIRLLAMTLTPNARFVQYT